MERKMTTQTATTERIVICRRCQGYGRVFASEVDPKERYPVGRIPGDKALCPECKGDGRMVEITKTERIYRRLIEI